MDEEMKSIFGKITSFRKKRKEQKKQEALTALKAEETKVEEKVEEVTAPKVVEPVKTYTAKFKVEATIDQIKDLKTFMDLKGIKYDSIK